jgi:sialate O-acetylesterase
MIAPLTNFPVAGAIWYQGETNIGAATYDLLLTSMIKAWRQKWNKEFPFYFVQLAPYAYGNKNVGALLREAQTKTLALSKTGMAVITDLADDTTDIHPKNKRDVGYRLATLALVNTYGQAITNGAVSPSFHSMTINKNKINLSFLHAENGFAQKGRTVIGFFIAGEDRIFFPAQAKIDGKNIVVWSKEVAQPVAVRYAFSNTAIGNIFSKEGLPLAPFRTDEWEVDTSSVK